MDLLTFIVEMTRALVWPAALVTIVLLLRGRIANAIDRLKSLKHGDTEFSFGEKVAAAQEMASDVGITVFRPITNPDVQETVERHPATSVIDSWKEVGLELSALAERAGVPNISPSQVVDDLHQAGYLGNGLADVLRHLISLRNAATHDAAITKSEATSYLMLAKSVTERLAQQGH